MFFDFTDLSLFLYNNTRRHGKCLQGPVKRKERKRIPWREPGDRFVYGVYLPDYGAAIFNLRDARPFGVLNDIPASGPMAGAEE